MDKCIAEVVKEYVMFVEGPDLTVKSRITKSTNQDGKEEFHWDISHYYCPSEGAGAYSPSKRTDESFEVVEALLISYMKPFTAIGVTPNECF